MPDNAVQFMAADISLSVATLIQSTRPYARIAATNDLYHFGRFIKNAGNYRGDIILTPIDICVGFSYIEAIFTKLPQILNSPNRPEIFEYYRTDTFFHEMDELLAIIGLMLATKGEYGYDAPYNNQSFAILYGKNLDRSHSYSNRTSEDILAYLNQAELTVLKLLDFHLPRKPNRINHYAHMLFLKTPLENLITTGASLTPEALKNVREYSFPYDYPYQRFEPSSYPHPAPTELKHLYPVLYSECHYPRTEPAADPKLENAQKTQADIQKLSPLERRALVLEQRLTFSLEQQQLIKNEEENKNLPTRYSATRSPVFTSPELARYHQAEAENAYRSYRGRGW